MPDILTPQTVQYLNSLPKRSSQLISEMEEFAKQNFVPILDASSAQFLETIVKATGAQTVLEIGTAIGYSTVRIAAALPETGKIYTIEKSTDMILIAEQNFVASGLSNKIRLLKGEAAHFLLKLNVQFDLIFLDADKEDYKRLFNFSLPLLRDGGLYIVDNLLWHGYTSHTGDIPPKYLRSTGLIREFNNHFFNTSSLETSLVPIGDGLGIGYKTTKFGEDKLSDLHQCYKNFDLLATERLEEAKDIFSILELALECNLEKNFENLCFDAKYMTGLGSSIAKAEENPEINSLGTMREDLNKTILKFLQGLRDLLTEADEETQLYFVNKYLQQQEEEDGMESLLRLVNDFAELKLILNELKRG